MRLRNELRSGLFIVIALGMLASLVFIMGSERQIFAKQEEFYATFRDVKGLAVGAPIRLGGITIGRVAKVGFSSDLKDLRIHVTLLVSEEYLDRVRKDALVSIDTQGLLGDRFVSMSSGQDMTQALPKTTLKSVEAADFTQVIAKAETIADNLGSISEKVSLALEGFKPETFASVGTAFDQLSKILKEIHEGKGFIHRLVYSEKDGAKLADALTGAAQDIRAMVGQAQSGPGLMHALFYDAEGATTVKNFADALQGLGEAGRGLSELAEQAQNGDGLIHDLFYTRVEPGAVSARIQEAVAKLDATAENLKVTTDALSKGTGTLGALILDPRVYDALVEVTDGARRSFLLRQAIRSSLDK